MSEHHLYTIIIPKDSLIGIMDISSVVSDKEGKTFEIVLDENTKKLVDLTQEKKYGVITNYLIKNLEAFQTVAKIIQECLF